MVKNMSKQIVIYFTNGNSITIKDKNPFVIKNNGGSVVIENDSYYYEFIPSAISGMGHKLITSETEDTDDGK